MPAPPPPPTRLSPFERLRTLLAAFEPGQTPIDMTIGEPRHPIPDFVAPALAASVALFGKYPPVAGTPALRQAIADWHTRRHGITMDPDREVIVAAGSREALFSVIFPLRERKAHLPNRAVLMPDPGYPAYGAAARAAQCEAIVLPATRATGFLPDLDAIAADPEMLNRAIAFYLASPANPQGAVASRAYLERLIGLARAHDFVLLVDECYGDIAPDTAPLGALAVAAATPQRFDRVLTFNSLSKRSNLPGLRAGFVAGDAQLVQTFAQFRNIACPTVPLPVQEVARLAWSDDAHVAANNRLYKAKFDAADAALASRFGYYRPDAGFCLWLDVSELGSSEAAAVTIWQRTGVKVLPGSYLAEPRRAHHAGTNPGEGYVRLALVDPLPAIEAAFMRLKTL